MLYLIAMLCHQSRMEWTFHEFGFVVTQVAAASAERGVPDVKFVFLIFCLNSS